MLTQLLVAGALALAPAAPPVATPTQAPRPVEGVVRGWFYDANRPVGLLGLPTGPECYGLIIDQGGLFAKRYCVDRAAWKSTGLFRYFRGVATDY